MHSDVDFGFRSSNRAFPSDCSGNRFNQWGVDGNNNECNWMNIKWFSSIFDRLTQQIFSFPKNGRIIAYVFRITWHTTIVCLMLNGWKRFGDRIHSSRTQNRFNSKLSPCRIITCGCIAIKQYCTWWNWLCSWLVQWTLPFIRTTHKNVKCKSKAVSF